MTRPSHVSLHGILTAIFAGFLIIAALIAGAAFHAVRSRHPAQRHLGFQGVLLS